MLPPWGNMSTSTGKHKNSLFFKVARFIFEVGLYSGTKWCQLMTGNIIVSRILTHGRMATIWISSEIWYEVHLDPDSRHIECGNGFGWILVLMFGACSRSSNDIEARRIKRRSATLSWRSRPLRGASTYLQDIWKARDERGLVCEAQTAGYNFWVWGKHFLEF